MNSHNERGKNEKILKIVPKKILKAQNTRFYWLKWAANKSLGQVAKNPYDKIWKICLSVFHYWKFHPRVNHKGSRETFWVTLVIGASTREQVAKLSREKSKNPDFWKQF